MIMVKNRGLRSAVNKTLEKLESLCDRYDSCAKYVRKISDEKNVEDPPKTSTADANICCQADTPLCKACHEGISVEEYLLKKDLNVRILSTDRTRTFNIQGRNKQTHNYFTNTYTNIKRVFPQVETIVDYKTELYKNVIPLKVINPSKKYKIRLQYFSMAPN